MSEPSLPPARLVLAAVDVGLSTQGGGVMTKVTPVAVAVALLETVVLDALATSLINVPDGSPAPVIVPPSSDSMKLAVADVTVFDPVVVTPSVTVRATGTAAFRSTNLMYRDPVHGLFTMGGA